MRYVLAAIFICALGLPEASALPTAGANSLVLTKAPPIEQVAKRNKARPRRKSQDLGGIHPLVGSGGY
ncbi:MAG: hypothetical protein WB816_02875 [Methylocystis sp.]